VEELPGPDAGADACTAAFQVAAVVDANADSVDVLAMLPEWWAVGPISYDPGIGRWSYTARGPHPGRGKAPETITGTGEDELAAMVTWPSGSMSAGGPEKLAGRGRALPPSSSGSPAPVDTCTPNGGVNHLRQRPAVTAVCQPLATDCSAYPAVRPPLPGYRAKGRAILCASVSEG
jgi:hypothetical protein